MKNKYFTAFRLLLIGSMTVSSSLALSQVGGVAKEIVKTKVESLPSAKVGPVAVEKISEADFNNSTHCEPLLRAAINDEELAKKIFLNSTNLKLEEYKKEHLYACFRLLDKKNLQSIAFVKDLVKKYPILYGDIEEPLHSNKEVITAAAAGMGEYKYCILPILELPPFVSDKKLKESIAVINPFCKKYLSNQILKVQDEENSKNAISYFKTFLPFGQEGRYPRISAETGEEVLGKEGINVFIANRDYQSIINTVKNNDIGDDWFYRKFSDSSTYAMVIEYGNDTFSIINFSETDFMSALEKVEKISPPPLPDTEGNAQLFTNLAVNTVYKFYHENPKNLVFKNLKERLWNVVTLTKIIQYSYGGNVDKLADYIDPEVLNRPQITESFIKGCNPIINKNRGIVRSDFWKKLNKDVLKERIGEIFPCIKSYNNFFEQNSFANDSKFVLRMLDVFKVNQQHISIYTVIDFYNSLPKELKDNKDIAAAFFFTDNISMYSYLSDSLKKDPKIKLLAFKYSSDCYELVKSNPDDKQMIMDMFFPENINHDLEFFFGSKNPNEKQNNKKLKVTEYPAECFQYASQKIRGEKSFVLPILKKHKGIARYILPPASADPELVKIFVKSSETCSGLFLEDSIPKLSKSDLVEVAKLNIYCLSLFPPESINDEIYKVLKASDISTSIYLLLPEKYKKDIKIISNLLPFPDSLRQIPISDAEMRSMNEEDEENYENIMDVKREYNSSLDGYYKDAIKIYTADILIQLIKNNSVAFTINYLENHLPFIYYRYSKDDFSVNLPPSEEKYDGADFFAFKDQKIWNSLANKAIKEKVPCENLKNFYESHSDFWLPSKIEITKQLKCVNNLVIQPAAKK
jgi:hypothetical protein